MDCYDLLRADDFGLGRVAWMDPRPGGVIYVPPAPRLIYVGGSLRNPRIPEIANAIRAALKVEVFDDWYSVGPKADDHWLDYEKARGRTYGEALKGYGARNTFDFDKQHIDRSTDFVLVMPAGKSGHLELGYASGSGKRTYILFDEEPERWDVMVSFIDHVCFSQQELMEALEK